MKLQILQEKFSKALLIASRFTSTRAQLPVLGNVLLSAKKNKLLIASTNLEMSIVIPIGAQVEKEGEITIPAKTITDLVNNLSSGAIDLSVDKEQLKVKSQGFSSTLSGMNTKDIWLRASKNSSVGNFIIFFLRFLGTAGKSFVFIPESVDENP